MTKETNEVEAEEIPELTDKDWARAIRRSTLLRLRKGEIQSGEDIAALRRMLGLSQPEFANALEISIHTLRGWEQGKRKPEGPAIALLKIAARHPRIVINASRHGKPAAV